MNLPDSTAQPLTLHTRDGYPLAALRYPAQGPRRGNLIVAGATGVPQLFYKAFAEFAAAQGYTTLTLDYRGIGLSKPRTLRGFRMAYLDWAHQDLAAAVDAMTEDGTPLFMVGHSFGGHAFGLLPNHDRVARFYTFATGAGWAGWMPPARHARRRWRRTSSAARSGPAWCPERSGDDDEVDHDRTRLALPVGDLQPVAEAFLQLGQQGQRVVIVDEAHGFTRLQGGQCAENGRVTEAAGDAAGIEGMGGVLDGGGCIGHGGSCGSVGPQPAPLGLRPP